MLRKREKSGAGWLSWLRVVFTFHTTTILVRSSKPQMIYIANQPSTTVLIVAAPYRSHPANMTYVCKSRVINRSSCTLAGSHSTSTAQVGVPELQLGAGEVEINRLAAELADGRVISTTSSPAKRLYVYLEIPVRNERPPIFSLMGQCGTWRGAAANAG